MKLHDLTPTAETCQNRICPNTPNKTTFRLVQTTMRAKTVRVLRFWMCSECAAELEAIIDTQ